MWRGVGNVCPASFCLSTPFGLFQSIFGQIKKHFTIVCCILGEWAEVGFCVFVSSGGPQEVSGPKCLHFVLAKVGDRWPFSQFIAFSSRRVVVATSTIFLLTCQKVCLSFLLLLPVAQYFYEDGGIFFVFGMVLTSFCFLRCFFLGGNAFLVIS